jgi:hypothetical protein
MPNSWPRWQTSLHSVRQQIPEHAGDLLLIPGQRAWIPIEQPEKVSTKQGLRSLVSWDGVEPNTAESGNGPPAASISDPGWFSWLKVTGPWGGC